MPLPASGQISLTEINTELSLSPTAPISLNDAAVRTLLGIPSGPISLADGWGKSAVVDYGGLWAFGGNENGQLGDGTRVSKSSPVQVGTLTNWKQVDGGESYTTAIKTDGTLWAFGMNNYGQLGDGTVVKKSSPVQVGSLTNWKQVAGGQNHTTAIKTDGTLWAFGWNAYGQLGIGTAVNKSSPVQVGSLTNWKQVGGGFGHTTAIK